MPDIKARALAEQDGNIIVLSVKLSDDKKPPKEYLLWEFGEIKTTKGDFVLTKENAEAMVAEYKERGLDLPFDYSHQTFQPVTNGLIPAAGWHGLEVREDGFWLTNIEWTEKAYNAIEQKEIKYVSPAFEINEYNEIVAYLNCALTNNPATNNLKPLLAVALERRSGYQQKHTNNLITTESGLSFDEIRSGLCDAISEKFSIDKWDFYIITVFDDHAIFERLKKLYKVEYDTENGDISLKSDAIPVKHKYEEIEGVRPMKTLLSALGLAEDAGEAEAVKLVTAVLAEREQLLTITEAKTPTEALGKLQAWKTNSQQLASTKAELDTIKAEAAKSEVAQLVAEGLKEGKIPPATQEYWQSQPRESVEQYLSAVMPNQVVNPDKKLEPDAKNVQTLSDDDKEVAILMGNDPKAVAEHQANKEGV